MTTSVYLTFKSLEDKNIMSDISDESDYEVVHYLIRETEIVDVDFDDNTLLVKASIDIELDDGDLDTLTEELDYHFTNTMNDKPYNMELIHASTSM